MSVAKFRYCTVETVGAQKTGTFFMGAQHCKHHDTGEFVEYAYELNPSFAFDSDCRVFVQNAHVAVELYDDYVYLFDPDYMKRICRETWQVQALISDVWTTIDTTITNRYKTDLPNGVSFTKEGVCTYNENQVGTFQITYSFMTGRALKHDIYFTNTTTQSWTVRVVQTLIGLAGKRVKHALGEEDVTITEKERLVRFISFVNKDNPKYQYLRENLVSLGHWEPSESGAVWVNDYLRAVRFKLVQYEGKELVRCDIIIGNYELVPDGSLNIDPDTDTWYVDASTDDCSVSKYSAVGLPETSWGGINLTGDACARMGRYSTTERDGGGVRFLNITIPQGATISSAYLKLYVYDGRTGGQEARIYGEDADDTVTFDDVADYNSRVHTTAFVEWDWNEPDSTAITSPDLVAIIKEIVDRGSWSSGNSMVLLCQTEEGSTANDDLCESWDRNSGGVNRPRLDITWVGVGGLSIPVAMHHYNHHIAKIIRG